MPCEYYSYRAAEWLSIQNTIWLMDQSKNWTDPHDLNTRLVRNMDPHCSLIRENVTNPFAVLQNSFYYQEMVLSVSHPHQKSPWGLQLGAGAAPQRLSCQGWGRNPGCRANYTSGLRRNCNGVRSLNRKNENKKMMTCKNEKNDDMHKIKKQQSEQILRK